MHFLGLLELFPQAALEELLGAASFLCVTLCWGRKKNSHPKVNDDDEASRTLETVPLEEVIRSQNQ